MQDSFSCCIIGLLAVYSSKQFILWFGKEFSHLGFLAILLVFPVVFKASADNLNYVMITKLKFKQNATAYLMTGILTAVFSAVSAYFFRCWRLIIWCPGDDSYRKRGNYRSSCTAYLQSPSSEGEDGKKYP